MHRNICDYRKRRERGWNDSMIIQRMTAEDTKEVARLEEAIFSMPWSEQGFLDTLNMPNVLFLVAKQDGDLCGYCGVYIALDEGEITNVAVAPEYRKQGIGQKLLQELMQQAKEEGVVRFVLEVRQSNEAAIHLYQKNGFSICGSRKRFYERPVEDAYVMCVSQ